MLVKVNTFQTSEKAVSCLRNQGEAHVTYYVSTDKMRIMRHPVCMALASGKKDSRILSEEVRFRLLNNIILTIRNLYEFDRPFLGGSLG